MRYGDCSIPIQSAGPALASLARVYRAPSTQVRAAPPEPRMPFVGRKVPLGQLHRHLEEVRQGTTRVVHVHGPSGIGKTALARQFLAEVRRSRTVVLEGACHPQESVPYRALDALIDNLARYLLGLEDRVVLGLAPRHAEDLVRLFPVLGRVPAVRQWPTTNLQLSPRKFVVEASTRCATSSASWRTSSPSSCGSMTSNGAICDSGLVLRALLAPPDAPRLLLVLSSRWTATVRYRSSPRSMTR